MIVSKPTVFRSQPSLAISAFTFVLMYFHPSSHPPPSTFVGHRAAARFGRIEGELRAVAYNAAIFAHMDAVHGGADFPDWG